MRTLLRSIVAILFLLASGLTAGAADFNWKSAISGNFSTQANWQPTGLPGPADTAIFNLGSAGYTVSLTGPPLTGTVAQLKINNDTVTLDSPLRLPLTANSLTQPSIGLGNNSGDVAKLTLVNGVPLNGDSAWIGVQQGAQATLTINGGSTLATGQGGLTSGLVVGAGGNGTLSINSGTANIGGQLTIARDALSQGTFTLDGSHSRLTPPTAGSGNDMTGITVGAGGNGQLSVTNGAVALGAGPVMVGQNVGSQGSIYLDGANSLFSTAGFGGQEITSVTIGGAGQGSLAVSGGAAAKIDGPLVIGQSSSAQGIVTVDGAKSALTAEQKITAVDVGAAGTGTLSVSNGGLAAIAGPLTIGTSAGSHGTVTVDGANSLLGSKDVTAVTIGSHGQGSLSITHGATATLGGQIVLGSLADGNGTATIDGLGSLLNSPSSGQKILGLTVAADGAGTLSVINQGVANISKPVVVGQNSGSHGTVTVDGAGSQLLSTSLSVGSAGSGELSVTNGGVSGATAPVVVGVALGSTGHVTIDGVNSQLVNNASSSSGKITIGQSGAGQLDIAHGGALSGQEATLTIGANAGSNGTVTVSGPGSKISLPSGPSSSGAPTIVVGQNGTGALSASNGAAISSAGASVGVKAGSSPASGSGAVTLDGRGTIWNTVELGARSSYIGQGEAGSVRIINGAEFRTSDVTVGYGAGSVGTVEIAGAGSLWTLSSSIFVGGGGGVGSLSISDGGQVNANGSTSIGQGSTVDIQQGSLTAYSAESRVYNHGTLINDGTINGNVTVFQTGVLSGSGIISGQLSVNQGTISPGDSPGKQTVGSVDFNSSAYQFEINSASGIAGGPIGWDLLKSQASATLAGITTMHLVSLDQANDPGGIFDFDPDLDYHWTFLTTSAGISGFDAASFFIDTSAFSNPLGGHFSVSQVGNNLQLNYLVPEPSSYVLAGAALVGLGILAQQKARRARRDNLIRWTARFPGEVDG